MESTDATTEIEYKIVLEFSSFTKAGEFLSDLEAWQEYKKKRLIKKEDDKRGSRTKELHTRTRAYHEKYPLIPYRDCFKIIDTRRWDINIPLP